MGLAANQFANTNANFATVTFNVTDGYQTIEPIDVTVTIKGHNNTVDYDGIEHIVTGYEATADTDLYDVTKDFTFSGNATARQIYAGTTYMGLAANQFANINANFATVTFIVTDGYQTVEPIDVTVTIVGNTSKVDYDGIEHIVTGYEATADTDLYDVTKDIAFIGIATARQTNAGTTYMGLKANRFVNKNTNFANVTFIVTDGYQTVVAANPKITTSPQTTDPVFNGSDQPLITAGEAEGGTLYYALGNADGSAPDEGSYQTTVPYAKEAGNYFVWYKVEGDSNHGDLSPVCIKVIVVENGGGTLRGVLYQPDGTTALDGVTVTLVKGNQTVDSVITADGGKYQFTVSAGVYNIIAEYETGSVTVLATVTEKTQKDIIMPDGKTESALNIGADDETYFGVAVGGLDAEASSVRKADNVANDKTVSVVMTVEQKVEETAANADLILSFAKNKSLKFIEIKVEKTIDSVTTVIDETINVLEIVVPYEKAGKKDIAVYRCHGNSVEELTRSDSKESGTFSVDAENGLVYIYTNRFSTYAIGYTPYYSVNGAVLLGSFGGTATVTLLNDTDGTSFTFENVAMGSFKFENIPCGQYTMTVTWTDGADFTLTMPVSVNEKKTRSDKIAGIKSADGGAASALLESNASSAWSNRISGDVETDLTQIDLIRSRYALPSFDYMYPTESGGYARLDNSDKPKFKQRQ